MQTEFRTDVGDIPLEELSERLREVPEELTESLSDAVEDIGARIRGQAQRNAPVDRSRLRSSLEYSWQEQNGSFRLVVGSNVDQAGPMEHGTEPGHFPPPSELRGWARRVLGDESAAWPVARSIAETGLEERRYLRDAFDEHGDYIMSRLTEAVNEAFEMVGLA